MAENPGFLSELKRRNVLRAGALYVGSAWALAQGVSQLAPALDLPDWATRAFLIACAIAFPFWLAFAWYYELTPQGFKRERDIGDDTRVHHSNARRLDFAIIAVLVVAVALLASGYFVGGKSSATSATAAPANSIVVLPFKNLGANPQQAYFSNGITEELTSALGQNTGLSVIAWDTASRYADSRLPLAEIGKALNVAHVLDGSIQRAGNEVRVSAELVDATSGRQVWAEHYDDTLKNIFAVQDKISSAIADALRVKFAGRQAAPTLNPAAHDLYLKGLAALQLETAAGEATAQRDFNQALALDPNYADAWAGLAGTYRVLSEVSTLPLAEAQPQARAAADKALALDPQNVNALLVLAGADVDDGHLAKGKSEYRQALLLDRSNADAHLEYADVLPVRVALAQDLEAARLNPADTTVQNNLATLYQDLGDWRGMTAAATAMVRLSPHNIDAAFYLAFAYSQQQRKQDAIAAFALVQPESAPDQRLLAVGRLTYQSLLQPALRPKAAAALASLQSADASPTSQSDLLQLYLALGERPAALQLLTGVCAAAPALCSDLAINPMYASLHNDPRFAQLAQHYTTVTLDASPTAAGSD